MADEWCTVDEVKNIAVVLRDHINEGRINPLQMTELIEEATLDVQTDITGVFDPTVFVAGSIPPGLVKLTKLSAAIMLVYRFGIDTTIVKSWIHDKKQMKSDVQRGILRDVNGVLITPLGGPQLITTPDAAAVGDLFKNADRFGQRPLIEIS